MNDPTIKILIADDNTTDRLILSKLVATLGYQVVTAEDGEQAVECYQNEQPQIVLLDAMMPKLDGFQVASTIKKLAGDTLVPIIFLTSLSDAQSLARGLEAGGDDFLSKPYNSTVIKAKINAFNRMRVAHQQLKTTLEELELSKNRLVQREKMASLGELVAGVAHEVNTPIGIGVTAISHLRGLINTLKAKLDNAELDVEYLESFIDQANEGVAITENNLHRSADLVKSFKQVAVDQSSQKNRNINLLQHINEILLSLRPQLKKSNHEIYVNCDESLCCECDAGAFTQVVTNLIMNSIIHGFEEKTNGHITINIHQDDNDIQLLYHDDGCGIPESHLKSLFEPFFTTKRGKGGSGLGTHIIYNQVTQALGGTIGVNSVVGEGSTFKIIFPAVAGKK